MNDASASDTDLYKDVDGSDVWTDDLVVFRLSHRADTVHLAADHTNTPTCSCNLPHDNTANQS